MSRIYLSHLRSKARRSLRHGLDGRVSNYAKPVWLFSEAHRERYASLTAALEAFDKLPTTTGMVHDGSRPLGVLATGEHKPRYILMRSRNGRPYAERF